MQVCKKRAESQQKETSSRVQPKETSFRLAQILASPAACVCPVGVPALCIECATHILASQQLSLFTLASNATHTCHPRIKCKTHTGHAGTECNSHWSRWHRMKNSRWSSGLFQNSSFQCNVATALKAVLSGYSLAPPSPCPAPNLLP
eukprot:575892-Rhodomonas_salina.2